MKKSSLFFPVLAALLMLAASTLTAQTALTNTGKTAVVGSIQYYGFNIAKPGFDSLYFVVHLPGAKMWTEIHVQLVGDNGRYMANNFESYATGNGTLTRKGNVISLTPSFEGITTLTLSGVESPRLAVRLEGSEEWMAASEGKDSTHVWLHYDMADDGHIIGVTWFPPKGTTFTLSISDTNGYSKALDAAYDVHQAKEEAAEKAGNNAEVERLMEVEITAPNVLRQAVNLPTVGTKKMVTVQWAPAYVTEVEVLRLR